MKKTLIAFAALSAIAGMAQAQSSVTLYGLVDAFFGQTQTELQVQGSETQYPHSPSRSSGLPIAALSR